MKFVKTILFALLFLTIGSLATTVFTTNSSSESTSATSSVSSSNSSLTNSSQNSSSPEASSSSAPDPVITNEYTINLRDLTSNTTALTTSGLLAILNERANIFASVDEIALVYRNEGSLKFGNSSSLGSFKVTLKPGIVINQIQIIARTYSRYNSSTQVWSCDKSGVDLRLEGTSVPWLFVFPTNESNNKVPPRDIDYTYGNQLDSNSFQIIGEAATETNKSYRFDLYQIHIWHEA